MVVPRVNKGVDLKLLFFFHAVQNEIRPVQHEVGDLVSLGRKPSLYKF